ncbi:hypothetical protein [Streptomyces coeruleorubidus]|uniref:hypothetical protein n=1 Tax=Streptomyces coeruleorubidus TaxID=116188 RepID=UPI0036BA00D0
MPARNDDGRRDADYDGTDALMAALVDDPLPEDARHDAPFMAAHRAAAADVTLLREQLLLIGETLARDTGTEAGAAGVEPAVESHGAASRAGEEGGAGAGGVSPAVRRGRPRALGVALRGLAAAAAVGVVVGMGWLVVQGDHGSSDDAAGSSAADSAAGPPRVDQESKPSHAGYLACARLVAEGTVAEVEPVPGTGQDRVTLDVDRYYKPAKGQDRVVFPMDEDAAPQPRPGERVLVGITRGQAQPDLWKAGEKEIAPERARIAAALPESGNLPCQ